MNVHSTRANEPLSVRCEHGVLSAVCRECADPLDVRLRPDLSRDSDPARDFDGPDPFTFAGERPTQAEVWRAIAASQRAELTLLRDGDPAAVPGWWAGIPFWAALIVLGIVIDRALLR